jgi:hypothetical protein
MKFSAKSAAAGPIPRASTAASDAAGRAVTTVCTEMSEGTKHYRLLFGEPLRTETVRRADGTTMQVLSFAPAARFALDLWRRLSTGSTQSRCFVCEAISPGEEGDRVPCVRPAARVLLETKGAAQSRVFLAWLAELQRLGTDPVRCPREIFEAAHFRLQGSRANGLPARRLSGRP